MGLERKEEKKRVSFAIVLIGQVQKSIHLNYTVEGVVIPGELVDKVTAQMGMSVLYMKANVFMEHKLETARDTQKVCLEICSQNPYKSSLIPIELIDEIQVVEQTTVILKPEPSMATR